MVETARPCAPARVHENTVIDLEGDVQSISSEKAGKAVESVASSTAELLLAQKVARKKKELAKHRAEAAEQDTAALASRAPYGTSPCQPSIIPTIDKAARMFGLGGGRLTSDSSVSLS